MSTDPVLRYLETRRRRDFAALVCATRSEVLDAALRVLGDRARAEDVAQDVFLQLLKTRRAPGEVRSGRGLLVAMAVSRARDAARGEQRRADRESASGGAGGGEDGGKLAQRAEEVRAAVDALPEDLRRCVELRYFGGLPVAEIARALEWAPRTTSLRLAQARERLAARLAATGFAPLLAVLAGDGGEGALPHLEPSSEWCAALDRIGCDGVPLSKLAAGRAAAPRAALLGAGAAALAVAAGSALLLGGPSASKQGVGGSTAPSNFAVAVERESSAPRSLPSERAEASAASVALEPGRAAAEVDLPRVEIEVVSPAGERLGRGTLEIELALDPGVEDLEPLAPWSQLLGEHDLADANPLVLADLPAAAAGLALEISVRDTGFPAVAALALAVRANEVTHLRVELSPAAGLAALVVDHATGAPVEGALVLAADELERAGLDWRPALASGVEALGADAGPGFALTGPDGRTTLDGIGRFPARILAAVPGRPAASVVVEAPGALARLALPPPARRATSVAARVLGRDGAALAGVEVQLVAGELDRAETTGADGVARFEDVALEGWPELVLGHESFARALRERGWRWSDAIAVSRSLGPGTGEAREIVLGYLPPAADVLVEVLDPRGAPVAGAEVRLAGPVILRAESGGDGVARFPGAPAGEYTVGLGGDLGSWSSNEELAVAPGPAVRAALVRGEARIEGRLVSARDGATGLGTTVLALGAVTAMTRADGEGSFVFEAVPPGRYLLAAGSSGEHAGTEAEVEVSALDTLVRAALLAPVGGDVHVVLGPALAGARLALRGPSAEEIALDPAPDEALVWRAGPLVPGRYALEVARDGAELAVREIDVRAGETARVELE